MKRLVPAAIGVAIFAGPLSAQPAGQQDPSGTWQNPFNSVHMDISPCGDLVCGKVVYATDKAKADAAKGGNPDIIGLNLLENFKRTGDASWSGKVFVPDLNHHFNGEMVMEDDGSLLVKGCLTSHVGCKHQRWTRAN